LGVETSLAKDIIYSDVLPLDFQKEDGAKHSETGTFGIIPIGPSCRLCERPGCLSRVHPPITRPLGLDEMVTGMSAYDFQ